MSDNKTQYLASKNSAALFDLSDRGKLICGGLESKTFLNSVISAEVDKLGEGLGVYAAYLETRGKYLADLKVFSTVAGLLIDCPPDTDAFVLKEILRYKFRAKITLTNVSGDYCLFSLQGPKSNEIAKFCGISVPSAIDLAIVETAEDAPARWVARVAPSERSGLWMWADRSQKKTLWEALKNAGATESGTAVLDVLRVEAGIPEWGRDIDETIIPMEALQQRALSFSKCYPGQEVLSRIHFRGHVNRMLQIIAVDGDSVPPVGASMWTAQMETGHLTSVVRNPETNQIVALGYIKRQTKLNREPLIVKWDGHEAGAQSRRLPYETE